jgi:hypothetical protein
VVDKKKLFSVAESELRVGLFAFCVDLLVLPLWQYAN